MFEDEEIKLDEDTLNKFGIDLTELMRRRLMREERNPTLRMSNIGKPDRQIWMDLNYKGEREKLRGPTHIKFMYGDIVEQFILVLAKIAGHTVEMEQAEVEVDGIKGHIDCVIDGVVVDVKSASSFSFKKFETGSLLEEGNDPFGYVGQLAGYRHALKLPEGAFLAVDKTLGKLALLRLSGSVLDRYDVEKRITHVKDISQQEAPPPHCYGYVPEGKSGNLALDVGCSYCQFKQVCHPGLRTFLYSGGPKYLVSVKKLPNVPEL